MWVQLNWIYYSYATKELFVIFDTSTSLYEILAGYNFFKKIKVIANTLGAQDVSE